MSRSTGSPLLGKPQWRAQRQICSAPRPASQPQDKRIFGDPREAGQEPGDIR